MSLLLRQTAQPTLDLRSLEAYHCAINTNDKQLEVRNGNGDRLLSLKGIRFANLTPTKKEIKMGIELLDGFLTKHWLMIKAYIDHHAEVEATPAPKAPKGFEMASPYRNSNNFGITHIEDEDYTCTYRDSIFKWTFFISKEFKIIPHEVRIHVAATNPEQISAYKFDEDAFRVGLPYIQEFIKQDLSKVNLSNLKNKLFKFDV